MTTLLLNDHFPPTEFRAWVIANAVGKQEEYRVPPVTAPEMHA